jgi:uncharacterized protein YjbI with pentapeptide repeats
MTNNSQFMCHCADPKLIFPDFYKEDVRKNVCQGLPFHGESSGHHYCVLHYPGKEKAPDFEKVFNERVARGDWNFEMVFFPNKMMFHEQEFTHDADFGSATFADRVLFRQCKFRGRFEFFNATFLDWAEFTFSEFFVHANFNAAEFKDVTSFAGVTFHEGVKATFKNTKFVHGAFQGANFHDEVEFNEATFIKSAGFLQTEFHSKADFEKVTFPKGKETSFHVAEFHSTANFESAEFFETDFSSAKFALAEKSLFDKAIFKKAKFNEGTSFSRAEFYGEADFTEASFMAVGFGNVIFARGANFSSTSFSSDASFHQTQFGQKTEHSIRSGHVYFNGAVFGKESRVFFERTWFSWATMFDYAQFKGYVFFSGGAGSQVFDPVFEDQAFFSSIKIDNATIEKPEQIYFHTVRLRPSWFVNVDCRKFNFTNIEWSDGEGKPVTLKGEIEAQKKWVREDGLRLLAIALRRLAVNAEENNRFDEASRFRRMAMEAEWLERKNQVRDWISRLYIKAKKLRYRFGGSTKKEDRENPPTTAYGILRRSGDLFIYGIYRLTSFYGESWSRAAGVLLVILVLFALFYTRTNFYVCPPDVPLSQSGQQGLCGTRRLSLYEGARHSLATAALQNVDYRKPVTGLSETLVILEKIFAPFQTALLALAIRRKFMR